MNVRRRPESCLSDFALDRRLESELAPDEEAGARDHLASCPRCSRRWDELQEERRAFAAEAPPLLVGRPLRDRVRPRPRLAVGAALLGMAAALTLLLRVSGDRHGTRAKGDGWRVGLYVNHAGLVRAGGPGERVEPGDALRFTYSAREPLYVAVLSVDGAKRASVYFPDTGPPLREEPGVDVALPLSTVLDATLGAETIYAVGCPRAFDVEALRQALERTPDGPPSLAEGCAEVTIPLHKDARGPE